MIRKLLWRTCLALLLATASSWWVPASATSYKGDGRSWARCAQACDVIQDICHLQCDNDCQVLYAGDQSVISACVNACRDICADQNLQCRLQCKFAICVPGDPPPCPQ